MRLKELLVYQDIVIQCHDNPDADAIGCGFALYTYFKNRDKNVRLVYSGKNEIQKSNLVLMVEKLHIPIAHVTEIDRPQLLVTVDCQYGQSNVTKLEGDTLAVIDHHQVSGSLPELNEVRSNLGSCSTLVRELLQREGIDVNDNIEVATALYYGHMTDTCNFTEISHPMDKDMRDDVKFDHILINLFRNSNLSLEELRIAGEALMGYKYDEKNRFALVEAKPCDPNILGIISDLTLEVDKVDCCLVYSVLSFGIKYSVRSCVIEVNAGELAEFIADGVGGGGGHMGKAGGFIQKECVKEGTSPESFIKKRMEKYFADVEIIYASAYECESECFKEYRKKHLPIGYVRGTDLVSSGTEVLIRTLEGDLEVLIEDDVYIMIGIKGEVYPCKKEKFARSYQPVENPYIFDGEYEPSIKENKMGQKISLIPFAKSCIANGEVAILAKKLENRAKVFTTWDREKYMRGNKGDYLACRKDDLQDVYIIEKDIFAKTYEAII